MKKVPKIIFRKMTLEENINVIKWAYFEDNELLSVHDYTIKYFEELKDVDKNLPKKEYDSPYLSWQYSEMITDPILNSSPFNNIFECLEERGYNSFYEMYDGDEFMNFQGRIALFPGLKFGLIGLLGIYVIVPLIDKFKNINDKTIKIITYLIIILFIIDVIIHIFTGSTYVGPV